MRLVDENRIPDVHDAVDRLVRIVVPCAMPQSQAQI
jgi:hypothetical protein